jgi:hypothetical protein
VWASIYSFGMADASQAMQSCEWLEGSTFSDMVVVEFEKLKQEPGFVYGARRAGQSAKRFRWQCRGNMNQTLTKKIEWGSALRATTLDF